MRDRTICLGRLDDDGSQFDACDAPHLTCESRVTAAKLQNDVRRASLLREGRISWRRREKEAKCNRSCGAAAPPFFGPPDMDPIHSSPPNLATALARRPFG
jgi:hypothetical protein